MEDSTRLRDMVALVERALGEDQFWQKIQVLARKGGERALRYQDVLEDVVQKHLHEDDWRTGDQSPPRIMDAAKVTQRFVAACKETLELIFELQSICNEGLEIVKMFLPTRVSLIERSGEEQYELAHLDEEGRPIYRTLDLGPPKASSEPLLSRSWLRWHRGHRRWAARTDERGEAPGDLQLDSALVTDRGTWVRMGGPEPDRPDDSVLVVPKGKPLLAQSEVQVLREVFFEHSDHGIGAEHAGQQPEQRTIWGCTCTNEVLKIFAGLLAQNREAADHIYNILRAACEVTKKLGLGDDLQPTSRDPSDLFKTLVHLAGRLADRGAHSRLKQKLPDCQSYDEKKGLLAQCMICNRRLMEICDLRNTNVSFLPRLFHRLCLWSWQNKYPKQVRRLNIGDSCPPEESGTKIRFVVVSDTHRWDPDLELPEGDVLLHCGNMLLGSSHVRKDDHSTIPNDLTAALDWFRYRCKNFQWIFVVGGNHDQALYDLWHHSEEKLFKLLPDNLVLLQAHQHFGDDGLLGSSGAARKRRDRDCVAGGAVRLKPVHEDGRLRLELDRPTGRGDGRKGLVIAGSGVSLPDSELSQNRAFQPKLADQALQQALEQAAKALLQHEPDVVMSHGPPSWDKGDGDIDGDMALRKALESCSSWKVVLFGHALEHQGEVYALEHRRPFVSVATCTPLYVPWRPPIYFELYAGTETGRLLQKGAFYQLQEAFREIVDGLAYCRSQVSESFRSCCQEFSGRLGALCQPLRALLEALLRSNGGYRGALIEEWLPHDFVAEEVRKLWRERAREKAASLGLPREEAECARWGVCLSEFDVAGPAVLFGLQSVLHWAFAVLLTIVAYKVTGNRTCYVFQEKPQLHCERKANNCPAFMEYPMWLWCPFFLAFWHLWNVQMKCLSYVILTQVQLLGRGFDIFGFRLSFRNWRVFIYGWSLVCMMDITNQCLFYGQFLKSAEQNPRISQVWSVTIKDSFMESSPFFSNIIRLFTIIWLLMFIQLVYMVLHMFPTHDTGVSYKFASMPDGFTTLASHVLRFQLDDGGGDYAGDGDLSCMRIWDCCLWLRRGVRKQKQELFKFWHADNLRVLAIYGRMASLMWEERDLMIQRLKKELAKKNLVRFLQIMFPRLKEFVSRIVLIDILEKALKLEIQVSVFAIDLALQPNQTSKLRVANKQMLFAILLSSVSAAYSLYTHVGSFLSLAAKRENANPQHASPNDPLNRKACASNYRKVGYALACYAVFIIILLLFIMHSLLKFYMAFTCQFSMWNWGTNCVVFNYTGTDRNRTLVLHRA